MAYLEELLPEFRKGAKIRRRKWIPNAYIYKDGSSGFCFTDEKEQYNFTHEDIVLGEWELYQEPIDWQYIIDNRCLCYFWDYNESKKHIGILKSINKYETYKFSIVTPDNYVSDISFVNCRPVRRDEVTFYEEKEDEI